MTEIGAPLNPALIGSDQRFRLFFPHAHERGLDMRKPNRRFVYYTSAAVASRILENEEVWLRNALTMNDFSEIKYGLERLDKCSSTKNLYTLLNSCQPTLGDELQFQFGRWRPMIETATYLMCMSEHLASEDNHGRLSMWRAYGGSTAVAVVIDANALFGASEDIGAFASPVEYLDQTIFEEKFRMVVDGLAAQRDYIRDLPRREALHASFDMLRYAVLSTKHPAFLEEREWRIVAFPALHFENRLVAKIETVGGVPQIVYKISLRPDATRPSQVSLATLLYKIIVGPCEFPYVVAQALLRQMSDAGIPDPESKIAMSEIPLRRGVKD